MKRIFCLILVLLFIVSLTACGEKTGLQDGYYTAQAAEFDYGTRSVSFGQ